MSVDLFELLPPGHVNDIVKKVQLTSLGILYNLSVEARYTVLDVIRYSGSLRYLQYMGVPADKYFDVTDLDRPVVRDVANIGVFAMMKPSKNGDGGAIVISKIKDNLYDFSNYVNVNVGQYLLNVKRVWSKDKTSLFRKINNIIVNNSGNYIWGRKKNVLDVSYICTDGYCANVIAMPSVISKTKLISSNINRWPIVSNNDDGTRIAVELLRQELSPRYYEDLLKCLI